MIVATSRGFTACLIHAHFARRADVSVLTGRSPRQDFIRAADIRIAGVHRALLGVIAGLRWCVADSFLTLAALNALIPHGTGCSIGPWCPASRVQSWLTYLTRIKRIDLTFCVADPADEACVGR